jgi:hypothetical protein
MGTMAWGMEACMLMKQTDSDVRYYPLHGLLPEGNIFALHMEMRTLSLLCEGPMLIKQQQFSDSELRVLTPILDAYPYYCSYDVLLAHTSNRIVTASVITDCHQRLQDAHRQGTLRQELKPVRRAISSLRAKLRCFHLEISIVREEGCNLTLLMAVPFL